MIDLSKLAFSTLGCAGESVESVIAHGKVGRCNGVELRCRAGELIAPDTDPQTARAIGDALRSGGLAPVCLATYVQVGAPHDVRGELERHLELASAARIPSIRVFGGEPGDQDVPRRAASRLREVANMAEDAGVAMLLETHDALLEGRQVAQVLDDAGVASAGAIWDVLNPWRAGEDPETTAFHLESWLRHVQVKDAASTTDLRPLVPGTGVVPLVPILSLLADSSYGGWVALEWESAWFPDAPPLDEALVSFHEIMSNVHRHA